MRAITGVDDRNRQVTGEKMRRTRSRMAHYDRVGAHSAKSIERIDQRLAFRDTRSRRCDGNEVRAEALRSDLETRSGAGGCFEKQIHDRPAAEAIKALETLSRSRLKIFRTRQDSFYFRAL